ncbi:MAG: MBG domain-containing protein [Bacteroidales bacterium]|nr:MBG domain-containing protein [Bacteroidales bacterium]
MLLLVSGVVTAQDITITIYGPGTVTVDATPHGGAYVSAPLTGPGTFTILAATHSEAVGQIFDVTASAGSFNRWIGVLGLDNVSPNTFQLGAGGSAVQAIFFTQLTVTVQGVGSKAVVSVPSATPVIPNTDINFPGGVINVPGNSTVVNITAVPAGVPDLGYGFYQWHLGNVGLVNNPLSSNTFINVEGGDYGTAKSITLDTRKIIDFTFVTTPSNKPYDGTNTAVAPTPTALYGLGGLTFATGVFTFNDVNAANNIPMTGVMTITDAEHMFNTTLPGGALTKTYNPTANITPALITVTADAGQTKVYGSVDPVLTYTGSIPLFALDVYTGALTRAAGETVTGGPYAITQGTLNIGPIASNYTITYVGDNFAIATLPVTVTADAGQTKVYGSLDPAVYTYTSAPAVGFVLPNGDAISFTGALTRTA